MNRRLFFAIPGLAILIALPAGCGGSAEAHTDASKAIQAAVNGEFTIALEANPSTGYGWQSEYDKTLLNLVSDEYKADPAPRYTVGSGGKHYYRFKALKAGQATVTFTYRQSWVPPSAADKKNTFTITIK